MALTVTLKSPDAPAPFTPALPCLARHTATRRVFLLMSIPERGDHIGYLGGVCLAEPVPARAPSMSGFTPPPVPAKALGAGVAANWGLPQSPTPSDDGFIAVGQLQTRLNSSDFEAYNGTVTLS